MKKYEIMYILRPDLEEEARKAEIDKLAKILQDQGAKVNETNEWGLRDFAYEIDKLTKGYYVILQVEANKEALDEFIRLAKIDRLVVRHLITVSE